MTITITQESNYAHGLTFESVEAVELEVSALAPHRDMTRYPDDSDARYVARLLDLPLSAVTIAVESSPTAVVVDGVTVAVSRHIDITGGQA